jgi:hypothetical protein
MSERPPEIEASDAMLAEAAKMDLVAMRHVQQLVLACDDAKDVGVLVNAYARVSRCMRQNLGLLARQKADRAKAEREAAQPRTYPWEQTHPADERAEDLQDAVGRVISAAADGDRRLHADWVHRFDRELDDWCEEEDFLDAPLGAQVLRACRTLGLPDELAARWQDLPEPTFFPDPAPESETETAAADATARAVTARYAPGGPDWKRPPDVPPADTG